MINKSIGFAIAHSAGHLHQYMVMIEQWPTKAGTPRKDLVQHAQRQVTFLRAMLNSAERELHRAEGSASTTSEEDNEA